MDEIMYDVTYNKCRE